MTDAKGGDDSIRDLLLGVHDKLDAMRSSYRRITRDRLKDRDTLQRQGRRLDALEHQVALLCAATPSVADWRANSADLTTSEHTALEIADLDIDE